MVIWVMNTAENIPNMSKLKIVFLIIYNIFLMNGGLALLMTKYRIFTELPLFIFLIIQYRHKIKKNIARSELKYVLLRLILIAIVGGRCVEDIGLLLERRTIATIIVMVIIFIVYKKWLTSDLDRIKEIPHIKYLYGVLGIDIVASLFEINMEITGIIMLVLSLLFMLAIARDSTIKIIKRRIAWVLCCWCGILTVIVIIVNVLI